MVFDAIESGKKKVETRALSHTKTGKNFGSVQKGDTLLFMCGKSRLRKKVKNVRKFKSIEKFFKEVNQKLAWPHLPVRTLENIKKQYYIYPGYRGRIKKHGLVAFWI